MSTRLVFNGIDAATGSYLLPPTDPRDVAIDGLDDDPDHLAELRWRVRRSTETTFAPVEGIDPKNIAECGWGAVFPVGGDPAARAAVRAALAPLLEHRQSQAGERFRILEFHPGDSKQTFLARYNAGPGPADPSRVPYYLLLVGQPSEIPFRVQHQLDVQYAIGRIAFDTADDYAIYARSVVAAETTSISRPLRATFFGTSTAGDAATELSAADLVAPLAKSFKALGSSHMVEPVIGELATKDRLRKLLSDAPSLLFTATHGVGFASDHPAQRSEQGAILCQDWPGPSTGALSPSWYFGGSDVDPDEDMTGLLVFMFACFGAGTPEFDDYAHRSSGARRRLAPSPFIANLPQRLLANPGGGALAVVGHIDRAWGYSFAWPDSGRQTGVFESCLRRLIDGHPIGSAMEYFNDKYAELSADLNVELEDVRYGKVADPLSLIEMWTANNDARAYTTIGDPAVALTRAPAGPPAAAVEARPGLELANTEPPSLPTNGHDAVTALRVVLESAARRLDVLEVVTREDDPRLDDQRRPCGRLARTTVTLGGDTETVVTPTDQHADTLLQMHHASVDAAVAARAELLRALPVLLRAVAPTDASQALEES